jgi:hypothetical protein
MVGFCRKLQLAFTDGQTSFRFSWLLVMTPFVRLALVRSYGVIALLNTCGPTVTTCDQGAIANSRAPQSTTDALILINPLSRSKFGVLRNGQQEEAASDSSWSVCRLYSDSGFPAEFLLVLASTVAFRVPRGPRDPLHTEIFVASHARRGAKAGRLLSCHLPAAVT